MQLIETWEERKAWGSLCNLLSQNRVPWVAEVWALLVHNRMQTCSPNNFCCNCPPPSLHEILSFPYLTIEIFCSTVPWIILNFFSVLCLMHLFEFPSLIFFGFNGKHISGCKVFFFFAVNSDDFFRNCTFHTQGSPVPKFRQKEHPTLPQAQGEVNLLVSEVFLLSHIPQGRVMCIFKWKWNMAVILLCIVDFNSCLTNFQSQSLISRKKCSRYWSKAHQGEEFKLPYLPTFV